MILYSTTLNTWEDEEERRSTHQTPGINDTPDNNDTLGSYRGVIGFVQSAN